MRLATRKYPISIATIARRWTRATDRGKGIRLEADEMDLLNSIGAGEMLLSKAAEEQREAAIRRLQAEGRQMSEKRPALACFEGEDGECRFHPIPLAMTRKRALLFTGLSAKVFADMERKGSLVGRRLGPSGAILFETAALRSAVEGLFNPAAALDWFDD